MFVNGYRSMWLLVMFDLPTKTKTERQRYTRFRKHLLEDGFTHMQHSVYKRSCSSLEKAETHLRRLERHLPKFGDVRVMTITDKQYEKMQIYWGKSRQPIENAPTQLLFF
jgi:CRISPR-associated protein Cas2